MIKLDKIKKGSENMKRYNKYKNYINDYLSKYSHEFFTFF